MGGGGGEEGEARARRRGGGRRRAARAQGQEGQARGRAAARRRGAGARGDAGPQRDAAGDRQGPRQAGPGSGAERAEESSSRSARSNEVRLRSITVRGGVFHVARSLLGPSRTGENWWVSDRRRLRHAAVVRPSVGRSRAAGSADGDLRAVDVGVRGEGLGLHLLRDAALLGVGGERLVAERRGGAFDLVGIQGGDGAELE